MGQEEEPQTKELIQEMVEAKLAQKLDLNKDRIDGLSARSRELSFKGDIGDLAQSFQDQREISAMIDFHSAKITIIKAKLAFCYEGKWNRCGECGGFLDLEKLRSMPETIYCQKCNLEKENNQKPRHKR